jgi:hypothetical protein
VDLELVLLADTSGSITEGEFLFQRQSYAAALTDPAVIEAIGTTLTGRIAVTYVEWAANQQTVVDWTVIDSPEAARAFADTLLSPPRLATGHNAIGNALARGAELIQANRITSTRQVIDFSGDSTGNTTGIEIEAGRDLAVAAGITVNALPILDHAEDPLLQDYKNRIIGGPGAFAIGAVGRQDFVTSLRLKLVQEIAGVPVEEITLTSSD